MTREDFFGFVLQVLEQLSNAGHPRTSFEQHASDVFPARQHLTSAMAKPLMIKAEHAIEAVAIQAS